MEQTFETDIVTPRACLRCEGEGVTHSQWAKENGYEGPEGKTCYACKGKRTFEGLNLQDLIDAVFTHKGGIKRFRKAFPQKLNHYGDLFGSRAYYVWRLARFHGGIDMRMPMTAEHVTSGDPFNKELEIIASAVARKVFGTDMAAARTWGRAFGLI